MGSWNMAEENDKPPAMEVKLEHIKHKIAVMSGKGGVGYFPHKYRTF